MEPILARFARAEGRRGRSPKVVGLDLMHLRITLDALSKKQGRPVEVGDLSTPVLQGHLDSLKKRGLDTVRRRHGALRRFCAFLHKKGLTPGNLSDGLTYRGQAVVLPKGRSGRPGDGALPLSELVARFFQHLRDKGSSQQTIEGYGREIDQCQREVTRIMRRPISLEDLTHERLQRFLSSLPCQPATLQRKRAALQSFFKFLLAHKLCSDDPTTALVTPKLPRRLPGFLSLKQAQDLVEAPLTLASGEGSAGPLLLPGERPPIMRLRDAALLELLYDTGLRPSEVAGLDLSDVRLDDPAQGDVTLHVRHGKGDKERYVPWCGPGTEVLRAYLARRLELLPQGPGEAALFVAVTGLRLSRRGITETVHRYEDRSGVVAYPRLLRHSYATHILWAGGDPRALQDSMGHDDASTTAIYAHTNLPFLRDKCAALHPRASGKAATPAPAAPAPEEPAEVARLKAENAQLLMTVARMAEKRGAGEPEAN